MRKKLPIYFEHVFWAQYTCAPFSYANTYRKAKNVLDVVTLAILHLFPVPMPFATYYLARVGVILKSKYVG